MKLDKAKKEKKTLGEKNSSKPTALKREPFSKGESRVSGGKRRETDGGDAWEQPRTLIFKGRRPRKKIDTKVRRKKLEEESTGRRTYLGGVMYRDTISSERNKEAEIRKGWCRRGRTRTQLVL